MVEKTYDGIRMTQSEKTKREELIKPEAEEHNGVHGDGLNGNENENGNGNGDRDREGHHRPGAYLNQITISDLEGIRLVLQGHSVADWARLNFKGRRDIDGFLKVNGFDVRRKTDSERLDQLRDEAVAFIEKDLDREVPAQVSGSSVQELLKYASGSPRRDAQQIYACMILKVMHTINYVDARALFHRWSVSEKELFRMVERRLIAVVRTMKRNNFNIIDFQSDHKSKSSLVTKLLAKRESHGTEIYDRIRIRIIIESKQDLLPVLFFLGRNICPFNYVVPGNSSNNLVTFESMVRSYPRFTKHMRHLQRYVGEEPAGCASNEFSSDEYRIINFISEIPLRIDRTLKHNLSEEDFREFGRVIFTPVEFQIADQETALRNEEGEASHQKYKTRQRQEVVKRLQHGSVKEFIES